jgi:hypothetical protein
MRRQSIALISHGVGVSARIFLFCAILALSPALLAAGTGTGLWGDYYSDTNFINWVGGEVDPTINFNWNSGSPFPGVGASMFSVRWTGQIQPLYSEAYTFTTTSDDGVRLLINGQTVISNWTDHASATNTGTITLLAGQLYSIEVDYYQSYGLDLVSLQWASASQGQQVVPASQLYTSIPPTASVTLTPTPLIPTCLQSDPLTESSLWPFWLGQCIDCVTSNAVSESTAGLSITSAGYGFLNGAYGLTQDGFYYAYQVATGNFTVVLNATSYPATGTYSAIGLMLRETTDPGSRQFSVARNHLGYGAVYYRSASYTATASLGTSTATYAYLQLIRNGNTVTGAYSNNGTTWSGNFSYTFATALPATLLVGIANASGVPQTTGVGVVKAFTVSGSTCAYTATPTFTSTPSITPTYSVTSTSTITPSITSTVTSTRTITPSSTGTISPTSTSTVTSTNTSTVTPTLVDTSTLSPTNTSTLSPTNTSTLSPTNTSTLSPTNTSTLSPTNTSTRTATGTATLTETVSCFSTASSTLTPAATATFTATPTWANTATGTSTATCTMTSTATASPTRINSGSVSIYNASGILVRTLTLASAGPTGGLQFSATVFRADGLAVLTISGYGLSFSWDGRDKDGQLVFTGNYNVLLDVYQQNDSLSQQQGQIIVAVQRGTAISGHVWPNPAGDKAYLSLNMPLGSSLDIRMFDLAGHLVLRVRRTMEAAVIELDLKSPAGSSLANGVYILTIYGQEPGKATAQRLKLKIAVLK